MRGYSFPTGWQFLNYLVQEKLLKMICECELCLSTPLNRRTGQFWSKRHLRKIHDLCMFKSLYFTISIIRSEIFIDFHRYSSIHRLIHSWHGMTFERRPAHVARSDQSWGSHEAVRRMPNISWTCLGPSKLQGQCKYIIVNYHLVIKHSHGKSPFLIGKPSINGPFPMAMLNNQRVNICS